MQATEGFSFVAQPDLNEVSRFICEIWQRPCWNYDAGLLASHIMRPSGDPSLAIGQVATNGTLASFQAYMPFRVQYAGAEYQAVFASFLTVSPEYQGKGLARTQQQALIDKAIDKGYDLYITMCENGAPSNNSVKKAFKLKGLEATMVKTFKYLAGVNELIKPLLPAQSSTRTQSYRKTDKPRLMDAIARVGDGTALRKLIPEADVDFIFLERPHTKTFVYERNGAAAGFINVLLLEVLDTENKLNVYFDNVYFGDLSAAERQEFLSDVLVQLQATNFSTAFLPDIGYVATDVFRYLRFRMAPREINLYIAPLKPNAVANGVHPIDSFYLDVY